MAKFIPRPSRPKKITPSGQLPIVNFRAQPEFVERLATAAYRNRMSLSEYCRQALTFAMEAEGKD